MFKTFKFKLYRSRKNKYLEIEIKEYAKVYNHCIALHKRYYRLYKRYLDKRKIKLHLTKLKRCKRFKFMQHLGSQAIQDVAERIDKAYMKFFRDLKKKKHTSPPRFKKLDKYKSFTLLQSGWKLNENDSIVVICGKKYRYFNSRHTEGIPKTITIKKDTVGDIFIYVACKMPNIKVEFRTGKSVGYDFGLKTFLTASDNKDIHAPLFFKENSKKIAKANRNLARKKKGSNHRKCAKLDLARIHRYVTNCRKDFHFKLANSICKEYAIICLEKLNIVAMTKLWGKKISDLGFSEFVKILEHVATKYHTQIKYTDQYAKTTQTCHCCNYVNKNIKNLKIREWDCPQCGVHHERDRNAAMNILRWGYPPIEEIM